MPAPTGLPQKTRPHIPWRGKWGLAYVLCRAFVFHPPQSQRGLRTKNCERMITKRPEKSKLKKNTGVSRQKTGETRGQTTVEVRTSEVRASEPRSHRSRSHGTSEPRKSEDRTWPDPGSSILVPLCWIWHQKQRFLFSVAGKRGSC
jgi:hypothetical protein